MVRSIASCFCKRLYGTASKANHKGGLTEAEEKVWANIVETDMSAKKYRKTFRHAGQKMVIRHGQLQRQFMQWINAELYRNSVLSK